MQLDVQAIWDELDVADSQVSALCSTNRRQHAGKLTIVVQLESERRKLQSIWVKVAKASDENQAELKRCVRQRQNDDECKQEWPEQRRQFVGQTRRGGAV